MARMLQRPLYRVVCSEIGTVLATAIIVYKSQICLRNQFCLNELVEKKY